MYNKNYMNIRARYRFLIYLVISIALLILLSTHSKDDVYEEKSNVVGRDGFFASKDLATYHSNSNEEFQNVTDDLFVASSLLEIEEETKGDVFSLVSAFEVSSVVNGDLYVVSQYIGFNDGAVVNEDAYLLGDTIKITGEIKGDLYAAGEVVIIEDATILGNIKIATEDLTITGNTVINGYSKLPYKDSVKIDEGVSFAGGVDYKKGKDKDYSFANSLFWFFASFVTVFLMSVLFTNVLRPFSRVVHQNSTTKLKKSLIYALLLLPAALFVLLFLIFMLFIPFITVFSLLLLLVFFMLLIGLSVLAYAYIPKLLGYIVGKVIKKEMQEMELLVIGSAIFALLVNIHGIGIIAFAIWLYVFGVIVMSIAQLLCK